MRTVGKIPNFIVYFLLLGSGFILMPAFPGPEVSQDGPASVPAEQRSLSTIKSLPYLQGYKPAPKKTGVVRYDEKAAYQGLNFYVSASVPGAFLVDMKGDPVHRWMIRPRDIDLPEESHCRRAYIYPNGDLLGIFEGDGDLSGPLVKLNKESQVLWIYRGKWNYDLFVAGNGRIYVLTHRERAEYPGQKLAAPVLEDFITVLGPDGKEIKSAALLRKIPSNCPLIHKEIRN